MSPSLNRHSPAEWRFASYSKVIRWVVLAVGIATVGLIVLVAVIIGRALDTDRDLNDFATPAEARTFTSAHLPAPLPNNAVIEKLFYERWTDWSFNASVRLPSSEAVDLYLEAAKRGRKLNDAYCHHDEPIHGARYFLEGVSACGAIERTSLQILEVHCNTR